jgi:O-antigen/teichoic acid export membrane protein
MTSRTKKAFNGTITSLLQYVIFIVLQAILAPLILQVAGQEVLGSYSIIMQIIGYGILLDLGFSVALSRFLSQAHGLHDGGKRFADVLTIGRNFLLVTNLIFAALIFLVSLKIGELIVASESILFQARIALCLLSAWMVLRTPLVLYNHGLIATQNMSIANLMGIVGNVIRLTLSLLLVYTGHGLIGLIAANIASEIISLSMQMAHFKKKYPHHIFGWRVSDNKLFREIFSFGGKYWGVNLAGVLFLGSDAIVVGNIYGASAASVFYTTKIPAFLLIQLIFRLSDSAAPATNELFAQHKSDAVIRAYLKILRYSLLLALPLAIGVIGFNGPIITAWVGSAQYAGEIMTVAIAAFVFTQVVNHINAMITLAAGDLRRWSVFSIFIGVMTLILAYWMGKLIGLEWVMVAIAVMDIPNAIFLFKRVVTTLKLSVAQVWSEVFLPVIWVCLPLIGLVIFIKLMGAITSVLGIIFYMAVFLSLWISSLLAWGLINSEKQYLKIKC